MTEQAFQAARILMRQANYARGQITEAEGNVKKWTHILAGHQANGREPEKVINQLNKAMATLERRRKRFESMRFPDHNLNAPPPRCPDCHRQVLAPNATHCGGAVCSNEF